MNEQPFLISSAPPHRSVSGFLSALCYISYATSLGNPPPLYSSCASIFIQLSLLFFLSLSDQQYSNVGAVAVHIKCYNPDAAGTSGHWCVHMHCLQRGPDVSGCLWQRWFINAASPPHSPPLSHHSHLQHRRHHPHLLAVGREGAGREHS